MFCINAHTCIKLIIINNICLSNFTKYKLGNEEVDIVLTCVCVTRKLFQLKLNVPFKHVKSITSLSKAFYAGKPLV